MVVDCLGESYILDLIVRSNTPNHYPTVSLFCNLYFTSETECLSFFGEIEERTRLNLKV